MSVYSCINMLIGLVVLYCMCTGITAFTKEEWLSVVDEFKQEVKTYSESGNNQVWAADWSETAIILPQGLPPVIGKQDYLKKFPGYLNKISECSDEITRSELVEYTDEIAVLWMNFKRACPNGKTTSGNGVYLLKEVNGKAQVKLDIWNYDA